MSTENGFGRYTRPRLTPAAREEIRERYASGESASALATEYGVTTDTVRTYAGTREVRHNRKVSRQTWAVILDRYVAGDTAARLAEEYGVNANTLAARAKRRRDSA